MEEVLQKNANLDAETHQEAQRLLEESGYRLAKTKLEQSDIAQVLEIEARAARHDAGSGRLLNLRLQAERGEDREQTLASRLTLLDYGILKNGYHKDTGIKSLLNGTPPTADETTQRFATELALYRQGDESDARQALSYFQEAVELAPADPAAHLNLAVCLKRLGREEEANEYLEKAEH